MYYSAPNKTFPEYTSYLYTYLYQIYPTYTFHKYKSKSPFVMLTTVQSSFSRASYPIHCFHTNCLFEITPIIYYLSLSRLPFASILLSFFRTISCTTSLYPNCSYHATYITLQISLWIYYLHIQIVLWIYYLHIQIPLWIYYLYTYPNSPLDILLTYPNSPMDILLTYPNCP